MKKFCLDLTLEDVKAWCVEKKLPAFRAGQIYKWLSSGVIDTEEMTNIPKNIREQLNEDFSMDGMKVIHKFVSEIDGTTKFVYLLGDGNIIETVVMRYKTGLSVCISSQAGCKMGCTFCASAKAGFGRSLTSGEMLGQVILSGKNMGEKIHNVVVMGIGEPFDNYDNLIGFIKLANNPDGLNLGARHITVSTCGLIERIKEFTALRLQVNLAISLHAPNDELRRQLMPVPAHYPLKDLIAVCRDYVNATGRRITFEYSLFDELNDTIACAGELARLLKGLNCHINLIAANEFPGSPYKRCRPKRIEVFRKELERLGLNATLRREMGTDIMAACGQLRRGIEEETKC
ncbi:MAG: 23S rRNA (adenine(2503)-C(2))-methyltransferase RlmN [Saccharofermentans sp.]|nr:23S rRNA (adenine(2503)-C(2))-methyltransferase RlmN [Saccharofermentans sp.]